jgi:predicted RNA binding protein YcfA (HicA-like mRNA interferase family)
MSAGRAETMRLVRDLRKQGFDVERTGSGHWKISHPNREGTVVMGFSPKSTNNARTLKRLAKIGYRPGVAR